MQIKAESLVLDEPVRPVAEIGPETGLTAVGGMNSNSAKNSTQKVEAEVQDWRVQRGIFDVWHLNIFWLTMSFIVEPPMMFFSNVWEPIRLVLL